MSTDGLKEARVNMWLALEHLELETHRGDRIDVGKAELACEIALLTLKLYEEEEDPWN